MRVFLTGPHEGKTINLRPYQFVDGCLDVAGDESHNEGLLKYLKTCYQAVPEWRYKEILDVRSAQRAKELRSHVRPAREEPAEAPAAPFDGPAGAQGGDPGLGPVGDGRPGAGDGPADQARAQGEPDGKRKRMKP
jgi:hypothetical protein